MKRVALYVRVSTAEQKTHGLSVDSQIVALQEYAEENGYTIAGIYNDAGFSARKRYTKRPALNRLLNDCRRNKIDLILFTKLDRWFRSVGDYYEVQTVLDACHVPWRTIWEDYETETSSGVFKVNIMLSVAQSEADRTSERIKAVNQYKKARGEVCTGGVGTGYKIVNKRWVKDEKTKDAVEAFFKTYLATFSQKEAIKSARALGLPLNKDVASHLLYKPAYCGGEVYVAEAYITKEEFEIIQKHKQIGGNNKRYKYIFSSLCTCGVCGAKLAGARTIYRRKDGKETHSISYVCRRSEKGYDCTGVSISESVLEEFLINSIESEMNKYNLRVTDTRNNKNNEQKAKAIRSRLNRLKDLYELGDYTFIEYKEKRALLLDELNQIDEEISMDIKELPPQWKDIYYSLDIDHKNAFWKRTIDHIEVGEMHAKNAFIYF